MTTHPQNITTRFSVLHGVVLILTLMYVMPCAAQRKVRMQQFSIENGLSQNTINTLFQDHKGYVWLGTQNGLNKFDGRHFTVYKNMAGDSTSISNNDIYAVFEDEAHQLWFGSRAGLSHYNREQDNFTNYDYPDGRLYAMRPVWCIAGDGDDLWMGASGGLFKFDKRTHQFNHYKINDSIQNANSARTMCLDRHGILWIGTQIGELIQFDRSARTFSKLNFPDHDVADNKAIASVIEDSDGMIWIAREDGSLFQFNREQKKFVSFNALKNKFPIRTMIEDKDGNLWIGTDKGGTFLVNRSTGALVSLGEKQENETDVVLSLLNDARGDMWLGTYHGGAYLFDRMDTTFSHYTPYKEIEHADQSNSVLSIFEDETALWIGTDGGGLIKKGKQGTQYFRKGNGANGIAGNTILCITPGDGDILYAGTYADGISVIEKRTGTIRSYDAQNGLNDNSVWAIYNDRDAVWIGTNKGGINVLDKKTGRFRYYTNTMKDERSISSNTIRCIFKDSRGKIWIGTVSGLNFFNGDGTFTTIYHRQDANTISNNNVLCIYEDSKKNLWMGTHGGGINRYDYRTNTFEDFQEKDGLSGNIVYSILEDAQGNLWMSTNKGISRFDVVKKEFKNFDTRSGLGSAQFNVGAGFKSSEGKMYFGNINGLSAFYPHHIRQNAFVPPVVITEFHLFNKPVSIGPGSPLHQAVDGTGSITLDYTQSVFSLTFAALNYSHADKNGYVYKLQNFDKDWIEAGNINTATYTNLDPGEYIFMVKGSNNDNVWNEKATTLTIIITPPFWKTWWFRGLILMTLISGLYGAYRFKINAIRKQKEVLAELVDRRTAEIEEKNKLLLETEKRNAQLVHQKLNDELATKSKELTNYTLLIVQKNRLLDELKKKLKDVVRNPGSSNLRDFKNLVQMINYNFSPEKEWKEFNANFNRVHTGFSDSLKAKFPELTSNDLRLCALYRIDIPTKDIAEAMGISQTSVKMARYRLRKKLGLQPEEDIHEFLQRIS